MILQLIIDKHLSFCLRLYANQMTCWNKKIQLQQESPKTKHWQLHIAKHHQNRNIAENTSVLY